MNNPEIVDSCVRQVDAVFHLASAVGVQLIIDQPVRTIESIFGGTDTVLRSCARYRRPIMITSTSEVYGKGSKIPFSEEDDRLMGPTTKSRWSYACAKALDKPLIILTTDRAERLPFDWRHLPIMRYRNTASGRFRLREALIPRLREETR